MMLIKSLERAGSSTFRADYTLPAGRQEVWCHCNTTSWCSVRLQVPGVETKQQEVLTIVGTSTFIN